MKPEIAKLQLRQSREVAVARIAGFLATPEEEAGHHQEADHKRRAEWAIKAIARVKKLEESLGGPPETEEALSIEAWDVLNSARQSHD